MGGFSKGDKVVLTADIGGWSRPRVNAGTVGVIVEEGGWGHSPRVKFDGVNEVVEVFDTEMR